MNELMEKCDTKKITNIDQKVREAQIRLLYQQTWTGLIGVLIVSLTACIIFWRVVPQWKLSLWCGVSILLTLARGGLNFAFQKRESETSDIDRWATIHVIGVSLSALMWAIPSLFLWPTDYSVFQLAWPILILPLSAAAVSTYNIWIPSYASFVILTVIPLSLRFFYEGGELLNIMGLLALFFLAVILRAGKVMHAASLRSLEFGIRNEILNVDLKEVATIREQLNARLQQKIVEQTLAEEEKERLIQELQAALDEIKTLEGVIPICMHCKGIRDDKGYWNKLENYITEHSEAKFSHGICNDCLKKHYPDMSD